MRQLKSKKRAKGTAQIRKEKRNGAERWGYDVWIRQSDGTRKRYRDFAFATKAEATQALAILRTTGWKARYGLKEPANARHTTIREAIESYLKLAKANLLANKNDDNITYWRETPSPLRTLERWGEFIGFLGMATLSLLANWYIASLVRRQLEQATPNSAVNSDAARPIAQRPLPLR